MILLSGRPASDVIVAPVYETKGLPSRKDISAVIITGSHAMVTDQDAWSLSLGAWLRRLSPKPVPVLGICYGHQLMAQAWGGSVGYHPAGREIGTVDIELTAAGRKDILLGAMPAVFPGHVTHAQTVLRLPPAARLLAGNQFEPHQAYVIGDCFWGVQFHPEFDRPVTCAYIEEQTAALIKEGRDVEKLQESVIEHDYGRELLRRFVALAK